MLHLQRVATLIFVGFFALGCATDIAKHSDIVTLSPTSTQNPGKVISLSSDFYTALRSGFKTRTLKQGSIWRAVGHIPAGEVYRPLNTVLMARTGHAHETYIVVDDNRFVGVFLPVERAYVRARKPHTIRFQEQQQ